MDISAVIWLTFFGLLVSVAVLTSGAFICKIIYALIYDSAVPWDRPMGDWKEEPDHSNWHLEKQFKRKFWRGVAVIVIVLAIVLILVTN